jgi:predicted ATPase/DNA-binding XRE family transcriptional regulator
MAHEERTRVSAVPVRFGEMLRQHRRAAGLTQKSLAERAGLSEHGIQKLESGAAHPYRDTAERLSRALQLADREDALFKMAAQPKPRRTQPHLPTSPGTIGPTGRSNLPVSPTSFIARAGEIDSVKERLRDNRLLTLSGPGGCGKTRLAVQIARQLESEFSDGVWLIDLAPLVDASLVTQAIATAVGIVEEPGRALIDALSAALQSCRTLLILDNCEHVVDTCAQVVDRLIRTCPGVRLLATSRELLGVAGEASWRVASLSAVDPHALAGSAEELADEVIASESGRLFIDRAQLVAPSFAITTHNAHAVAEVCHRLDGVPLAIELAAARLGMLGIEQIASRLDQCFRLLTGGHRTAVRRHQTLRATIDWSYQLLSEQEQSLVRRLAVFAGGWSLEAAEAVGADAVRREESVFEVLGQLVAKSMVLVEKPRETTPNIVRYRLLETIRQYAEEKLVEVGEADLARAGHRDWCLSFAEQGVEGIEGADQKLWWDRLNVEHDNLRLALTWSAAVPDESTPLLRLAGLLGRFWALNGFASEGARWLELALAQSDPTPSADRARALDWLGALEQFNGHVERACSLLNESVAQARSVGDRHVLARALRHLSRALRSLGDVERAWTLIEEAVAISRDEGFTSSLAWSLVLAAEHLESAGHLERVESLLLESVSAGRQSGAITSMLASTGALARLYIGRCDHARARRMVDDALALARQLGMHLPTVSLLITRGDVASAERDWDGADDWYRQALGAASLVGARGTAALALRHYAAMCAARGDPGRAARIVGATSSIGQSPLMIQPIPLTDDDMVAAVRRTLGEDAFAAAWSEGRTMTLEQAVTELMGSGCE